MKILSITAGAAGMYCGSCFRDNALARELVAQGHAVSLVPVYTPTRTDETNVSQRQVLFGGISVYLQQRFALFRHLPRLVDRLWDAPGVIQAFAGRAVSNDPRLLGGLTVSMLRGEHGALRREFEKLVAWTRLEPPPDVVNLPNSLLIAMAKPLRATLGRPVCCTLQGEELFLEGLPAPFRHEAVDLIRRQVADVDRFIAVSDASARFMADYLRIPGDRLSVVPLGINLTGYEPRSASDNGFTVGYFARVAPEKGLHLLAEAFARFVSRIGGAPARLEAAGYLAASQRAYLDGVRHQLDAQGLGDRFGYRGEVDRDAKLAFLRGLDVLSVPATYDEPKGMFLLEAMASGVPVLQPRRGAFVEIVDRTGGGLLVAPDDAESLAEGLYRLWADRALTADLARRGVEGVRAHYAIAESTRRLVETYDRVIADAACDRHPATASGT